MISTSNKYCDIFKNPKPVPDMIISITPISILYNYYSNEVKKESKGYRKTEEELKQLEHEQAKEELLQAELAMGYEQDEKFGVR